ncbi:MAG: hypothetical protein FJ217_08120 [Ignavibacteria bacterium]|nr:hypothetical protein [Ignavibacteria bacterium]
MNNRGFLLFATALLIVWSSCQQKRSGNTGPETVRFAVDPALLEARIVDTTLGFEFSPPKGWEKVSAQSLKQAEGAALVRLADTAQHTKSTVPRLLYAWTHAASGSIVMVSAVPHFDTQDSSSSLQEYLQLHRSGPDLEDARASVFYDGTFKVHQLLVTRRGSVSFKMIFSVGRMPSPVQFDFIISRDAYPQLVKTIESVAGSFELHLTNTSIN